MSDLQAHYHGYQQADPPHQPLYLSLVRRYLEREEGIRRVLDAGCGDCNFPNSLAEYGFEMHGLDQSAGGIAKARERHPKVHAVCGSLYDDLALQLGVEVFDAVISIEVIEHLYSPRMFLRRVHEALRPGGLLIVTTPYWGYLKNIALAVTDRMDRALTSLWEGGHIKHWSYRTLRQLLEEQGFEFVAFHGTGRKIPWFWSGMLMVARKPETTMRSGG